MLILHARDIRLHTLHSFEKYSTLWNSINIIILYEAFGEENFHIYILVRLQVCIDGENDECFRLLYELMNFHDFMY